MNRRDAVFALSALGVMPPVSKAQQPSKVYRIGFLSAETASGQASRLDAVRAGLREFGYVEGKNIVIEFRWAEGKYDRLPALATELTRLQPDVLITVGIKAVDAARRATTTIPIVIPRTGDPVASGLAVSLARPGGNITGSAFFVPEITAKQLELLKETAPHIARAAVLLNPANSASGINLRSVKAAAKSLRLGELRPFEVRTPNELDGIFSSMAKERIDAVVVTPDTMFAVNTKRIADLAAKSRSLSAGEPEFADAGGLIGYGANSYEMYRRVGYFVDKILKGVNPGDIPFERSTKFELVVNMKTAKAIGVTIPQSILLRVDRLIE